MEDGYLEMRFLGPPKISVGGHPVKFVTRKTLGLFIYLVVKGGMHPRHKLQAIFWPESEKHLAQSALRNTLLRIKAGLRLIDQPLKIEGDQIGFNRPRTANLDLDSVIEAAAEVRNPQIIHTSCSLFEDLVENVRGPFMESFSLPDAPDFSDWCLIQRSIWERRINLIFDHLSTHQLKAHYILPAIETVNLWLIRDHLNETAYRRLMHLSFLNGDRTAAIQTYHTCRRLLAEELEVEPSLETEELYNHIRLAGSEIIASHIEK
jgi:DNA-binding SARP family transcriptional activator